MEELSCGVREAPNRKERLLALGQGEALSIGTHVSLCTAFTFLKVIYQEVYPSAVPVKPLDICTTDTTQNILRGQVSHSPCPSTVTLHPNNSCPVISQQCLQGPYLFLCPFCPNTCIFKKKNTSCKYQVQPHRTHILHTSQSFQPSINIKISSLSPNIL